MGYYNVVANCVVEGRHYVRPTTQPIEVDDSVAAELVESGCLTPYEPGISGHTGTVLDSVLRTVPEGEDLTGDFVGPVLSEQSEGASAEPDSKPRRPRRNSED